MIYELRRYECLPGKLPIVVERFRLDAIPLWNDLGITYLGFWTTMIGESDHSLHYMLAWKSLGDRDSKWQMFAGDPRWQAAKARTEIHGPLVARISNTILKPVPMTAQTDSQPVGLHKIPPMEPSRVKSC